MTTTTHDNYHQAELDKFAALANRWWDAEGPQRALHVLNPVRLDYVKQRLPAPGLHGQRVLDVGCGGGILSEGLARAGAEVLGIDLAKKSLKVAQLHALEAGTSQITYRLVAAEALAAEMPDHFDVVTCMEMLEHVPDPASVVQACARLAKPGGWVFFSTINRNPKSFLMAILGAEYVLNLVPRGTHEYARLLRPSELARFCRDAGLDMQQSCGLQYNPISGRYRLSTDTSVNYMLATRKSTNSA